MRTGSFLGTAAMFFAGAPLVVTLIGTGLWHFGIGRGTGSIGPNNTLEAFAWYGVISVFVGWPAMLAMAVIMPWLSMRLTSLGAWLVGSAGVCAVLTLLSGFLIGKGGDFTEVVSLSWMFLLVGAAAGLACAFASNRFRPRPAT